MHMEPAPMHVLGLVMMFADGQSSALCAYPLIKQKRGQMNERMHE